LPNGSPRLYGEGEVLKHVNMRLIRCGSRRPDGPRADACHLGNTGAVVTGALEAPGSNVGKDAGVLAGLPANGVELSADLWSLSANADGILDFTVPAATIPMSRSPRSAAWFTSSAPPGFRVG